MSFHIRAFGDVKMGGTNTGATEISRIFTRISLLRVQHSIIIGPSGLICLDSTASTGSCPTCGSFFIGSSADSREKLSQPVLLRPLDAASCAVGVLALCGG